MRENKYRGLRTDGRGWVYGDLVQTNQFTYILSTSFIPVISLPSDYFTEVDEKTVGQFIRNDQYDTEIYEGDLFMNGDSIRIIEMSGGNAHAITPKRTESILLSFIIKSNPKNKIVGNIFQNPELLES